MSRGVSSEMNGNIGLMVKPSNEGVNDNSGAGRLGHTVKTATATLDPSCDGATVTWISCGSLCEFVEGDRVVTNPTGWTVSYRNKDPDTPSTEVDAEELVAEVTIPGKDGTVRASRRFTVVKVDVAAAAVGEDKEESEGAFIPYVADKDGEVCGIPEDCVYDSVRSSSIILGVRDEYYKSNDGCFRDCDHVERIRRANIRSEDGRSCY